MGTGVPGAFLTKNRFEKNIKDGLNLFLSSEKSLPQPPTLEFPHLGLSCLPRARKDP